MRDERWLGTTSASEVTRAARIAPRTPAFAVIGCERVGRSGLRALQFATLKDSQLVPALGGVAEAPGAELDASPESGRGVTACAPAASDPAETFGAGQAISRPCMRSPAA